MYNEERKSQFINQYAKSTNRINFCHYLFNKIEKYEEEQYADICTFSEPDLRIALDAITGIRDCSKYSQMSVLRNYVQWCIDNNIPDAKDDILKMKNNKELPEGSNKIRRCMVSNPLMLQRRFDDIFEPESKHTIDNIIRCYFWLAFSGISKEAALEVEDKDVDFANMIIRGKDLLNYPIYVESLECIRNCVELTHFIYEHPLYKSELPRTYGHRLLRGIRADMTTNLLNTYATRRKKQAIENGAEAFDFSYKRLELSGFCYRMYQEEKAGIELNFKTTVQKRMSIIEGEDDEARRKRIVRKAKFLENDYERWKAAFDL